MFQSISFIPRLILLLSLVLNVILFFLVITANWHTIKNRQSEGDPGLQPTRPLEPATETCHPHPSPPSPPPLSSSFIQEDNLDEHHIWTNIRKLKQNGKSSSKPNIKKKVKIFLAIGSRFDYTARRQEIRRTWLNWLPSDGSVEYSFFTDLGNDPISEYNQKIMDFNKSLTERNMTGSTERFLGIKDAMFPEDDSPFKMDNEQIVTPATIIPKDTSRVDYNLEEEMLAFNDIKLIPIPSGRRLFGARGLYGFHYALKYYDFDYYMRVDDDSFPCFFRILQELDQRPLQKFFWTKYWHQNKRTRVDENFLVVTRDIVEYITMGAMSDILPVDPNVDFGCNFTYWLQNMNVTIFDDVYRLDSHQSLLTKYMHQAPKRSSYGVTDVAYNAEVSAFCEKFIYAHHVHPGMMDKVYQLTNILPYYPIPPVTPPTNFLYSVDTDFYSPLFPSCICNSLPCVSGKCVKKYKHQI